MLAENLAISAGLVVVCVLIHAAGTAMMLRPVRSPRGQKLREGRIHHSVLLLTYVVVALLAMHALEIMAYAWAYHALGEFRNWEAATYFAASTFTTLGYGDVWLGEPRRMIAAIEGVVGLLLIGWSTAILAAVTARMGVYDVHRDPPEGQDTPND